MTGLQLTPAWKKNALTATGQITMKLPWTFMVPRGWLPVFFVTPVTFPLATLLGLNFHLPNT